MATVSENDGLLSKTEYAAFKGRSIRLKFAMQLFGALGAATFLGLVSEIAKGIMLTGAVTALSPWALGLAAIGAGCVFLSCKFMYESSVLDQDFQAKKIAQATGKTQTQPETQVAVAIEQDPQKERPRPFAGAPSLGVHANTQALAEENPRHQVSAITAAQKMHAADLAAHNTAATRH